MAISLNQFFYIMNKKDIKEAAHTVIDAVSDALGKLAKQEADEFIEKTKNKKEKVDEKERAE